MHQHVTGITPSLDNVVPGNRRTVRESLRLSAANNIKENAMPVSAIVGANWGDEGKGKITDFLAKEADFVVRFQGGQNAGHTVINDYGKFVLHLLPSGVFYPKIANILGPGVALDMKALLNELEMLKQKGIPNPKVFVSDRAQVVLPIHILFDEYEEERLQCRGFGSTKKGIAPFYGDKYLKLGIQMGDIFEQDYLYERINRSMVSKDVLLKHLYGKPFQGLEDMIGRLQDLADKLKPYLTDTTILLNKALYQEKNVLLEGQLGTLRDPDHGIYPFSTSSSPLAGFAAVGAGMPPHAIKKIIAVTKAYSTCVGAGPFVSEIFGREAETLRHLGGSAGEYGATTGRPRRVGWFDAVATKYGCRIQGATDVALTGLDVLGYLEEIPVCTAYEMGDQISYDFPTTVKLQKAKPVCETLKGWKYDISDIRFFDKLPSEARDYVDRIEDLIEVPIRWISVGPQREAIIQRI
jgi:adenylosuccinate synthase